MPDNAQASAAATYKAWWPMVLGTGYRGTIELMTDEDRAAVKNECLEFIRKSAVSSVEVNVVYAIATTQAS